MRHDEAIAALERAARFGINPSLGTITRLCAALGDPQRSFRVVQVAGTNGKGSTTRMIEALLRAHGKSAGAFVSPHLHELREHVVVGGAPVPHDVFASAIGEAVGAARKLEGELPEPPTQFELLTAGALAALRDSGVDWAVLEVGMGGRWDSTSVATPSVAVVTSVGLDHVEHLGPTLQDIAWDKAHVIKRGSRAVLGPGTADTDVVFARRAEELGVPVIRVREAGAAPCGDAAYSIASSMRTPDGLTVIDFEGPGGRLCGLGVRGPAYQAGNAACALAATALALGCGLEAVRTAEALRDLRIDGRFEVLARGPWVVADVAHNPAGARVLTDAVDVAFGGERVDIVLGMLSDKDALQVARELSRVAADFHVVRPDSPRGLDAAQLAERVMTASGRRPDSWPDVATALDAARRSGRGIVVTGSHVTVAEARVACGVYRPSTD